MLSNTSKLGCKSWSLQAFDTCPGAVDKGEVVDACKFCYARTGNYVYSNVKRVRAFNKEDWQQDDWVDRMVVNLYNERYFRWFDSGDAYALELAEKMHQVMLFTPWCNHWFPTRMHKFSKFKRVLEAMQSLPNVVVRLSSDSVSGEVIEAFTGTSSTIIPTVDDASQDSYVCPAYQQGGKCLTCRACWSKDVSVVAYPYHGRNSKKVIKIYQVKKHG